MRQALWLLTVVGCAAARPAEDSEHANGPRVPPKCTACHLAPKEHSMQAGTWKRFQQNHRRRVRLGPEEEARLYEFLVGEKLPEGGAR